MHLSQRDHATFLVEKKHADYLLFVKENRPSFYDAIAGLEEDSWSEPYTETGKGHGRIETRTIQVASPPADLPAFPLAGQPVSTCSALTRLPHGSPRPPCARRPLAQRSCAIHPLWDVYA
jgi:hypothetical protein